VVVDTVAIVTLRQERAARSRSAIRVVDKEGLTDVARAHKLLRGTGGEWRRVMRVRVLIPSFLSGSAVLVLVLGAAIALRVSSSPPAAYALANEYDNQCTGPATNPAIIPANGTYNPTNVSSAAVRYTYTACTTCTQQAAGRRSTASWHRHSSDGHWRERSVPGLSWKS
jgi:hypothetical protein